MCKRCICQPNIKKEKASHKDKEVLSSLIKSLPAVISSCRHTVVIMIVVMSSILPLSQPKSVYPSYSLLSSRGLGCASDAPCTNRDLQILGYHLHTRDLNLLRP